MIKVKLFATLADRSRSRKKDFEMAADGPLRVIDIIKDQLPAGWEEYVLAVVNGQHVELDHQVKDGDQVELMLAVVGG